MTRRRNTSEWDRLWTGVHELTEYFGDGLVFIGGVAVYLHITNVEMPKRAAGLAEVSHDGDFYISRADFADLRDIENVTKNRRLQKHSFTKAGVSFDVYVERANGLLVRFTDIVAESVVIDGMRVACLEHLLLLKLDAYADRRGSAKGDKDERDLIRLGYLLDQQGVTHENLARYLTPEAAKLFEGVVRSPEIMSMCNNNAQWAKQVRAAVRATATTLGKLCGP